MNPKLLPGLALVLSLSPACLILTSCSTVSSSYHPPAGISASLAEHWRWLSACLEEIETTKIGSTRADLLKQFHPNGGISTRTSGSYVYRNYPQIKVSVEFEPVGTEIIGKGYEDVGSPNDKIIKISKPYLESADQID